MSTTVTFTGKSSVLTSNFINELELDERFDYSCGLLDFTAYQSIPNIHSGNNNVYFTQKIDEDMEKFYTFKIPVGTYEYKELADYITDKFESYGITFSLTVSKQTLKTTIKCSVKLVFIEKDSFHRIFGFADRESITADTPIESEHIVKITTLNTIIIECDIVSGSYRNGEKSHSLYEFAPKVAVGYKIIEEPRNIVYLPIRTKRIRSIQLRIVDQNRNLVDFRGEEITCRIHIKRE